MTIKMYYRYGGKHAPGNMAVNTSRIVIIQQEEKEIQSIVEPDKVDRRKVEVTAANRA